jgi:hypothetical protein
MKRALIDSFTRHHIPIVDFPTKLGFPSVEPSDLVAEATELPKISSMVHVTGTSLTQPTSQPATWNTRQNVVKDRQSVTRYACPFANGRRP